RDKGVLAHPQSIHDLIELAEQRVTLTKGFSVAIDLMKALLKDDVIGPAEKAVMAPRTVAALDDATIAMFLDEFQNTRLPRQEFSVTGYFQEAVESPTCPHFVTGSALSILADELLGKGALYGRFRYRRIEPFTDYYGEELAHRTAIYYHAEISEIMAPVISDRCGGNPFYITSVVRQAAERETVIRDEAALNKLLAIDISSTSGFIWAELSDQVNR
ncbi:MAG: hypothetical protein GY859_18575, partial [Desulfobacterales bacterium]|nr:hypothetical protein [Desulfobacterales bacterium]